MKQDKNRDGADGCDEITRGGETIEDEVERGTCFLKEGAEDTHLHQQNQEGVAHDDKRIDSALCHHRT